MRLRFRSVAPHCAMSAGHGASACDPRASDGSCKAIVPALHGGVVTPTPSRAREDAEQECTSGASATITPSAADIPPCPTLSRSSGNGWSSLAASVTLDERTTHELFAMAMAPNVRVQRPVLANLAAFSTQPTNAAQLSSWLNGDLHPNLSTLPAVAERPLANEMERLYFAAAESNDDICRYWSVSTLRASRIYSDRVSAVTTGVCN